jgi:hypothetical protein
MRQLNLFFLAILLVALSLFGGSIHVVHGVQMRRNASALLDRARRGESANQPEKVEQALSQYLCLHPDDGPTAGRDHSEAP